MSVLRLVCRCFLALAVFPANCGVRSRSRRAQIGASSAADSATRGRVAEALGPDGHAARPRRPGNRPRRGRDAMPPMPITGIETAADTAATCSSAIARTAGPETPPVPPAEPRLARARVERHALERVDERDGVGARPPRPRPPPPRGRSRWASASRSAASRWPGARARARGAVSSGSAPMTSPVSTFGQDTLSSISATSSRSPTASGQAGELVAAEAHHRHAQRHRQLGELGQVALEEARRGPCSAGRSS